MKKTLIPVLLLTFSLLANSQVTLDYYLPKTITYNSAVPTPKQFFGHEIGEWHLTHDKLYYYMLELAKISGRAIWEEYGRSYETRPLGQLIISSPENIKNLEQLRQDHIALCDPTVSGKGDINKMPLFIKLGYGVHGNESSAQNASALVAYYLIAGEGKEIDELLKNTIILIDPALNPDGMQRHSTWVNFTRSLNNNPDPASWEFSETWPGGRTNHYWFDLNRDYLALQHPESQGRVAAFHRWKPNINTDHHETGANETFFFQPGIQSRNNPLTPQDNQELTAEIGKYHEKYLNSIGSLYFTEESFDDFYVGKGSSYPDIHGSVGILFEQAGVKGHLRETPGGLLSFPFAIRNHFTVSLSTLEAGLKMKSKLLESQRSFYKEALIQADKYPVKAYIFNEPSDNARVSEFINILLQHRIKVFRTGRDIAKNGITYKAETSYIVPLKQTEYRFIRSLFEPVTEFTDSIFYDTSTWVLPLSFNLNCSPLTILKEMEGMTGSEVTSAPILQGKLDSPENPYAFLFEWNEYYSPPALYFLQNKGLKTRVATESFVYDDGSLKKTFSAGTIVVPVSGQQVSGNDLYILMQNLAKDFKIPVYGVATGMTKEGIDLGSNKILVLEKPSVAMIVGDGSNSSDAGEIWHMLDTRFKIPVTMITASRFRSADLNRYNVLIITGSPDISPAGLENIRVWNRNKGTIIGYESGNSWLAKNKFAEIEFVPAVTDKKKDGIYQNKPADSQVQQIPGSIFQTKLDLTHPLCYGYTRDILPVFKSTTTVAKKDSNIYNNPILYTDAPLLSGYCTKENLERIKGTPFASVHGNRVISLYDNTNFRAYWYGTNKVFMNAIFFGQIIR
jgi:hypothetical protein